MQIELEPLDNGVKALIREFPEFDCIDTCLPTVLFSKGRQSVEVYWSHDYIAARHESLKELYLEQIADGD